MLTPLPQERIVAVVPVRGLEGAKSRLGGVLDAEERRDLVSTLLRRVVEAAAATPGVTEVVVVSPDPEALELAASTGARPLRQSGMGLNEGLEAARVAADKMHARAWSERARASLCALALPEDEPR